jgi:hypothetical protein
LQAVVSAQLRETADRAYAEGYRETPESDEEMSEATRLAVHAIHDEPWEKWW